MDFYINETYLTDVVINQEYSPYRGRQKVTADELIEIIKNSTVTYSISHEDHPEFTELRNKLESQGFIETRRNWYNGDRVLRGFRLNHVEFKPGDQFLCASAMKYYLEFLKNKERRA